MKQASVIAMVVLAAAVLLAAYAIGRLIRQTRLGEAAPTRQQAPEPNDANRADAVRMSRRISRTRQEVTPEEQAKIKQERAEKLEQMSNLSEEEREQLREDMRRKLRASQSGPGQVPQLTPEELEEMSRRWPTMSQEERAAFLAKMGGRRPSAARRSSPTAQPGTETPTAEPNTAGPN